jgi:hypothetical protein
MYKSVVEVTQEAEDVPAPVVMVPYAHIKGTTEPETQ